MKFKTGVYKLDRPGRECNNDLIFHLRSEVNRSQLIEERKARSVQENEFVNIIVQQFCGIYELWYFLSGKEKKEEAGVFESGNSSRAQPFLFLLFFSMYFHHFEFYLHCLFFFFLSNFQCPFNVYCFEFFSLVQVCCLTILLLYGCPVLHLILISITKAFIFSIIFKSAKKHFWKFSFLFWINF